MLTHPHRAAASPAISPRAQTTSGPEEAGGHGHMRAVLGRHTWASWATAHFGAATDPPWAGLLLPTLTAAAKILMIVGWVLGRQNR